MCVRYLRPEQREEVQQTVERLLGSPVRILEPLPAEQDMDGRHEGEVRPGVMAPIIVIGNILVEGRWGFSKWDGKGLVFNARLENVLSSSFFSPHLERGRCLVPATSYLEWEHGPDGRRGRKYQIGASDGGMLFMAGLARRHPQNGIEFTVLTCDATENLQHIHSRMPVLLDRQSSLQWSGRQWHPKLLQLSMIQTEAIGV